MAFNPAHSPEKLEILLDWLDPNRELASSRYLSIRAALVKIFESRGCDDADLLADRTMDRVMGKIEVVTKTFEGEPPRYFYGVARNVLHEQLRRRPQIVGFVDTFADAIDESDSNYETRAECLDKCINELEPHEAGFITSYYTYDPAKKVEARLHVAQKNQLTLSTMRMRAYRIRKKIRECLETCFEEQLID